VSTTSRGRREAVERAALNRKGVLDDVLVLVVVTDVFQWTAAWPAVVRVLVAGAAGGVVRLLARRLAGSSERGKCSRYP
jgi:hypothetical protein